jgi:hypothetical protein
MKKIYVEPKVVSVALTTVDPVSHVVTEDVLLGDNRVAEEIYDLAGRYPELFRPRSSTPVVTRSMSRRRKQSRLWCSRRWTAFPISGFPTGKRMNSYKYQKDTYGRYESPDEPPVEPTRGNAAHPVDAIKGKVRWRQD